MEEDKDYIGMNVEDAAKLAETRNIIIRIVSVNGVSKTITCDARYNRVNVYVVDDIIEKVKRG